MGIPLLIGADVIHGFKTVFPIPLAEAASWDMAAIEKGHAWRGKNQLHQALTSPSLLWWILPVMHAGEEQPKVPAKIPT
ncbi:hypothetical protein GCM10028895_16050 [Pontibacter rugosus]